MVDQGIELISGFYGVGYWFPDPISYQQARPF